MKILEIGTSKSILVSNLVAQISNCFSYYPNVEAIYVKSFFTKEENIPTILITLICNDLNFDERFFDFSRSIVNLKKLTGIVLGIKKDDAKNYCLNKQDKNKYLACQNLVSGQLLYDRGERFSYIKSKLLIEEKFLEKGQEKDIILEPPLKLTKKYEQKVEKIVNIHG